MQDVITRATGVGDQMFRTKPGYALGMLGGDDRKDRKRDGRTHGLGQLGVLDGGRTALYVAGATLSAAAIPATIAGILFAFHKKKGAKTALIIAGVFGALGASTAVFTAQKFAEEFKGEL